MDGIRSSRLVQERMAQNGLKIGEDDEYETGMNHESRPTDSAHFIQISTLRVLLCCHAAPFFYSSIRSHHMVLFDNYPFFNMSLP